MTPLCIGLVPIQDGLPYESGTNGHLVLHVYVQSNINPLIRGLNALLRSTAIGSACPYE